MGHACSSAVQPTTSAIDEGLADWVGFEAALRIHVVHFYYDPGRARLARHDAGKSLPTMWQALCTQRFSGDWSSYFHLDPLSATITTTIFTVTTTLKH